MSYLTKKELTNEKILDFISFVLSNEYAVINDKQQKPLNFESYLKISSRDSEKVVILSNYNSGISPYNIFTLTDYEFESLYPLTTDYTCVWRSLLSDIFPSYNTNLKYYLSPDKQK